MNYNKKVTEYIDKATEEQIVILETLRKIVHETIDIVSEEIKWNIPVFNNGKDFAYLRFAKKHITLGFYKIDKLIDHDNTLEGEGNTLKHLKIRSVDDIKPKKKIRMVATDYRLTKQRTANKSIGKSWADGSPISCLS